MLIFIKNSLDDIKLFDIGANEFNAKKFMLLPLNFKIFKVWLQNERLYVEWLMNQSHELAQLELQISEDGKNFRTLNTYRNTTEVTNGLYKELSDFKVHGTLFCRLKAITKSNTHLYSAIQSVTYKNLQKAFSIYPNPVKGNAMVSLPNGEADYLIIKNALGKNIFEKRIVSKSESVSINTDFLIPGYYFMELKSTNSNQINTIPFIKQ